MKARDCQWTRNMWGWSLWRLIEGLVQWLLVLWISCCVIFWSKQFGSSVDVESYFLCSYDSVMKAFVCLEHQLLNTRFLSERTRSSLDTIPYIDGLLLNLILWESLRHEFLFRWDQLFECVYCASEIPSGSLDEVCFPPSYGTQHVPKTEKSQKFHQTKDVCPHSEVVCCHILYIPLEQKWGFRCKFLRYLKPNRSDDLGVCHKIRWHEYFVGELVVLKRVII